MLRIFPRYNEHECWLLSKETKGKQNQMNFLAILIAYRKIRENKPWGLYLSKALFEGLICGGAYIWRGLSTEGNLRFKFDRASLIVGSKFTIFSLFYFVFEGNFPSTSPWGAYIWRGDLTEGFLGYLLGGGGGLYMEGLIFGILRYVCCGSIFSLV